MKGVPTTSPGRIAAGVAAIIILVALGALLPHWGRVKAPAIVEAAHTFSLASLAPGRLQWTLRSGSTAGGGGLIREKLLTFEDSELIDLEVAPGLSGGETIAPSQTLAVLHSLLRSRRSSELRAQQEELVARKALLAAGGRPEEITQAAQQTAVARAVLEKERAELVRLEALASKQLISDEELDMARRKVEIAHLEVKLAQATEQVVASSARSEALSEVDAMLEAVQTRLDELEQLDAAGEVRSPIAGVLELGGTTAELQVFDLSSLFLRIAVADEYRRRLTLGTPVSFRAAATHNLTVDGEIVDIAVETTTLAGSPMFWSVARIEDPKGLLQPGMRGQAKLHLDENMLDVLRYGLQSLFGELR